MKKLLLILLCLPFIGFAQQTYVPDDNFEQALINLGYDNVLDDYVLTSNISNVWSLLVEGLNIYDLTGIEDFTSLMGLYCANNQITSLNISNNIALEELVCGSSCGSSGGNLLTTLDVTQNINLIYLKCEGNQLTNIDLSNNTLLVDLFLGANMLNQLDVSNNPLLKTIGAGFNQLSSVNFNNNPLLESLDLMNNNL